MVSNSSDCSPPDSFICGISQAGILEAGCHFLLQGIFPTQGLNPYLLDWQADSLPLSHLGSPFPPYTMPQIISQAEWPPSVIKRDPSGWQVCVLMILLYIYNLSGTLSGLWSCHPQNVPTINPSLCPEAKHYRRSPHRDESQISHSPLQGAQSSLRCAQLAVNSALVTSPWDRPLSYTLGTWQQPATPGVSPQGGHLPWSWSPPSPRHQSLRGHSPSPGACYQRHQHLSHHTSTSLDIWMAPFLHPPHQVGDGCGDC